jgi:hypothetical protein
MPTTHQPLQLSKITARRQPLRTRGPSSIDRRVTHHIGPGEPPPGFLTPWNSIPEWYAYWALWKVLHEVGDVRNPRNGQFIGGEHFGYQTVLEGGRSSLGGQIVDFVVYLPGNDIGLYLQGDRYHIEAGSVQHAIDAAKMQAAARYLQIRPLYERDLIRDPTGESACRHIVDTLGGRRRINPITSGTYTQSRRNRLYGGTQQ